MLSFFKHFEKRNELLQKRWVFEETAPEAITAESIAALDESALLTKAQETGRALADKVLIAEDIVRRLTELKDEEKEAPLITPLKNLLTEIDASTEAEIKAQGTRLRERARAAVENIMQKGLLLLPSIGSIASAFNTLRTDISGLDLASLANGGWEKITKNFSDLMYYIKDLLPESLKQYLKDYIPDEAPATTSPAPEDTTPAAEETAEAPPEYQNLDEKIKSLSQTNIVPPAQNPTDDQKNYVIYTLEGSTVQWRVKFDGSEMKVKQGEEFVEPSSNPEHSLPHYLDLHKEEIDNLTNGAEETVKVTVARTLANLQKTENGKAFPIDVTALIASKWNSYFDGPGKDFGTKTNMLTELVSHPDEMLNKIKQFQPVRDAASETTPEPKQPEVPTPQPESQPVTEAPATESSLS